MLCSFENLIVWFWQSFGNIAKGVGKVKVKVVPYTLYVGECLLDETLILSHRYMR